MLSARELIVRICPEFNYYGSVSTLPEKSTVGTIVSCNGEEYVWAGEWIPVEYLSVFAEEEKEDGDNQLIKLECSSCGGQLVKEGEDYFCHHCGFRYKWKLA